jgi:arginyl-tRNA synthetase
MIKQQIKQLVKEACDALQIPIEVDTVVVDYPADAKHGDYSTNVALIVAKRMVGRPSPMEVAEMLLDELSKKKNSIIERVEVARPGFLNFWVRDEVFISTLKSFDSVISLKTSLTGKKYLVEFAHPNTHKAFHIGHLRNITTGESIVRLLEAVGVTVVRANYQGDVGMHIAKCLYGILYNPEFAIENAGTGVKERVSFLGKAYATGSTAYEEDAVVKKKIGEINKKIYAKDSSILALYQITRQWSLDYFETIYKRVGSHFDRYYFESEVYISGKDIVQKGLDRRIFEKSDNAIIFRGSQYGLHDRVFITGEGNPTYEGKEMGLGPLQFRENNPDLIMHVVGPEQAGYFQVVFEALAQLDPKTRGKEYHLVYGWVKLKHGKMSSRTGKVILGEWLIDEAKKKIIEKYAVSPEIAEQIAVSAVKYSFLKVGLGQEIAFDLDESISFEGNSGPYLQYTYVRTQSVLRKVKSPQPPLSRGGSVCGVEEREVLRLLVRFPEVVEEAAMRYAPNIVCTYLFELAQAFNVFYQKNQILKAEDEGVRAFRLELTKATGKVLKDGLRLLGIQAPKRM